MFLTSRITVLITQLKSGSGEHLPNEFSETGLGLTWQHLITLINTLWGLQNANRAAPQRGEPQRDRWVLYLLFLYPVISRGYLKPSVLLEKKNVFLLFKTHTHMPWMTIQAVKPSKIRLPGIALLEWSSGKEMGFAQLLLWHYPLQHNAQTIPLLKRKPTYDLWQKLWHSNTVWMTEVNGRLGLLPQRRELKKGYLSLLHHWGISLRGIHPYATFSGYSTWLL